MSEVVYKITRETCQSNLDPNWVCEDCGGAIEPIDTVDNSGDPTFWPGCLTCSRFTHGVPSWVRNIAAEMTGPYEVYGKATVLSRTLTRFAFMTKDRKEAAPDLYALLEETMVYVGLWDFPADLRERIEAALKKARGEA